MIFHLLGRHVCQERRLQNFFISLLCLMDMLSLVQEQFQSKGWKLAYQRCELQKENKNNKNQREHLNGVGLRQLRMYESREKVRDWNMIKLTQLEMQRKLPKGFNNEGNEGQIRQFYGSISETGF